MNKKIIGISGLARSGKDSLCKLLLGSIENSKRFALADVLKENINPFLIEQFGIDIFTCSPSEKELVRPLMVAYGKVLRNKTSGKFFTDFLEKKISEDNCEIAIITDVRYDEFKEDEVSWVKNKMGGVLVHLSRQGILPPNEDEAKNDPVLKLKSDISIEWETSDNQRYLKKIADSVAAFCLKKLIEKKSIV